MKLLITLIIIVLILLYLTNNKITVKKIKDLKYKNIVRNELFQVNNEDNLCPKLDPNIIFKMFEPQDDSYFGMINNNQPFIDYDSIKMIVESKNFIFFLNESMTQVIKLDKLTGSMLNITNKLFEKLKLENDDNTICFISMIGACFETDECFAFVKKYNSDNWVDKSDIIPYIGELWKLDPTEFFLSETKIKDSGIGNIKLDLIEKLHIESKIIYDKTYYNIYVIQKIKLGFNNYKTVLMNLHGSSIENNLNFYYGDVESLGLNCRYIGDFQLSQPVIDELIRNSKVLNTEDLNIFNLRVEYNNLDNNLKSKKYKNIFQFINTDIFKKYLINPKNEIKIIENLEFYEKILKSVEFQNYTLTDNEIDFNNRLDNIKKNKTLKFARECLKKLNQYKKILVNDSLNFGVQDFNVNSERIIIQTTNVKTNLLLDMRYVRLNTDFIKELILNDNQVTYSLNLYDNTEPKFLNYSNLLNYGSVKVTWNQDNKVDISDNLFEFNSFISKYKNKILENKILENGNILVKFNDNNLEIYQNNGDINEDGINEYQSDLNGVDFLSKNLQIMQNNFEYLMNFNDKEDKFSYNSLFRIRAGSLTGKKNVYGILDYVGGDLVDKNIFHKQPVYFTLYGFSKSEEDKKGPIYLSTKLNIEYELNPSIKFDHGGLSLYNWFVSQEKEGNFKNRRDWFEIYDIMKQEGIYYPNPKEGYQIKNSNFNNIMKYLKDSILEDSKIISEGLFFNRHMETLLKIKDLEVYNTDLDEFYPQLHLYKEPSLEKEEYYIYINFNADNQNKNALELSRISGINTEIEFIGIDKEPENLNINNKNELSDIRNENFKKKYENRDDNYKNEYHILVTKNKKEITKYPKNDPRKFNYIWKMKKINNFSEYLNLITDNVQISKNARDRVRGLYEIDKKFMDRDYLNYLLEKKSTNPNSEELDKIIEIASKNLNNYNRSVGSHTYYSLAHAYPFMVIYTNVNYNGDPCQEESKNSQKLFLTTKILKEHIINKENPDKKYTELKQYPFIKEEFLSFTGYGNDIQFYGKKLGGSTPIVPKSFCNYKPLPLDECKSDSCSPKKLGLVRLDGSPKCQIEDSTVKQRLESPNYVEIIGNVSQNACDLFKLKGNKKLYYRLGRIFKYGRDGKYQLKNMYTIQQSFDNRYFYFFDDKVILKNNLDLSKIDNYTFEGIPKTDIYGMYYVFKPLKNDKYLTRKINVFDRQFESWTLEDLKDISQVERNREDPETRIHKDDPDYYSQKFSIPDELVINMATQDKVTNPEIIGLQEDLRKKESLRCKTTPQLCEGDVEYEESMSVIEENKFLNKQLEDIRNMMNKINKVPASFTEPPNMVGLANKIKQLKNIIPKVEVEIINTIKANKYLLELENLRKNEEEKQTLLKKQEKINLSSNNNMSKNNNQSFFNRAMEGIKTTFNNNIEQPKCYSLEKFSNYNTNSSLNSHVSDEYSDYIEGKMSETRNKVADMQKEVGENLAKISELASSLKLNGSTKQILLSDKINQDNDLNKDIFKIKNADQQQRITNILQKISEIEKIRSEMEEDDFKTSKQENEEQYGTLISRTDGETINMYNIKSDELQHEAPSESNHNLLFINNGCLSYDDKLNINQQHCMIGNTNQMFQMHRIEDIEDMKKFNIKNQQRGMDRPFNIIRANDNKCLHKENNELSFRNCDNIENQYWDYSNITGSNN